MPHRTTERFSPPVARGGAGVVPVLAFTGVTVAVMHTLLVPVVKDLPALLDTGAADAAWVMTATLLSGAVATPVMGRLGDLHGKRRMLLVSLGLLVVGSLVCGFTDDLTTMLAGRTLQGFGVGAIPLGIGLLRDVLPRERLPSAIALMSSSMGVGAGLAPPGSALVAQHADWHMLFFGSAGLGVLAMAATVSFVPESPLRASGGFDLPGALGLSAGLVALLLPVTKGAEWGWSSGPTLGLFAAAAVLLALWAAWQFKAAAPLVDLRTGVRREVLLTHLAAGALGVAFYAVSLVLPQLLQLPSSTGYGLGRSMVAAGLCVAPLGVTALLVAPLYARMSARYGPRAALLLGAGIMAVGYGAGVGMLSAAWQTVVLSAVLGAGMGLAYSALPALITGAVDPSQTGAANGLNVLMRSVGTAVSSAVVGMVLAHTAVRVNGAAMPSMTGFRISFLFAAGAAVVGLALALLLPRPQRAAPPAPRAPGGCAGPAQPAARPVGGG